MNRLYLVLSLFLICFISSCNKEKVTIESLLNEQTDRAVLSYFPENSFSLKQFSSYDRNSISPDSSGWYANADYSQFIREEQNAGRREFVLLDAGGPGAVVRWWMTFSGPDAFSGIMRVYIDGSETPAIEGNILEILSGTMLAVEPLASSVSPLTERERRGHNLYLPIPYAKNCKITYECDAVKIEENRRVPSIYYNICYRSYEKNVDVESFSKEVLERAAPVIKQTAETLLSPFEVLETAQEKSGQLAENESLIIDLNEVGRAISRVAVKLQAEDLNQALRSTVIEMEFDGNQTIWIPAGEFFGTGYQLNPSKTWFTQVSENGWMEARWLMPYKKSAQLRLVNLGNQNVNAEVEISTETYAWEDNSMYFGASWHEFNRISTAKDDISTGDEWHFDMNYVTLKGQGVYVGDAITVFNTVDGWWGEGDEKIFVDGEKFPSSIGTGSEDYYGYAWCRPEKFSHPFIAQPVGDGSFHPGLSVNMRYRALDAIPFQSEINSNIEMWHWIKAQVNYAQSAFWYAKPGFKSNDHPDSARVKIPVAMHRTDIYKPIVDETGKIEGEFLEVIRCGSGTATAQSGSFGWSRESQLWWRNGETGSELVAKFILNNTGKFKISADLTKAVDYGIIQFYINGIAVGPKFDGYNESGVKAFEVDLGTQVLSEGENIVSIKILGANKNAKPGNMAGIDFMQFIKIN